jgi:8-oxo-dGTP diphosphatase
MTDIETIYGNKIRIRCAGVLIQDNHLLLIRHSGLGDKNELWSMPGGGMEFGENSIDTLQREFREETGLIINVGRFLFVYEYLNPPLHAVELYFEVHQVGGSLNKGTDPEVHEDHQHILETKFVSFSELSIMDSAVKHEILRMIESGNDLLNLSGYFKF